MKTIVLIVLCIVATIVLIGFLLEYVIPYIQFQRLKVGDVIWTDVEPDGYASYPYGEDYILTNPVKIVQVSKNEQGKVETIKLANGEEFTFSQLRKTTYEIN